MSLLQQQKEFTEQVYKHKGIVYHVCNKFFTLHEDIEDGFQDCISKAWASYGSYKGQAKFSTWLYKVSLYTIVGILRKTERSKDLLQYVDGFFDYINLPDENDQQIKDMQWLALAQEIRKLPQVDQELLYHYMDGRPYTYIAEVMDKEENALRVRMNRVKKHLKQIFIKH